MPRPQKHTVDYFSHDTNATAGSTIQILQARFGNDGYAAWFKLLELLGREDGHAYKIGTPLRWEFLSAYLGVQPDKCRQILECMAHLEAIDQELYKHDIIWSDGFVFRLKDLYKRRKCDLPQKPSLCEKMLTQTELPPSETIVNVGSNPHIKLNNIKEEKNIKKKEKKNNEPSALVLQIIDHLNQTLGTRYKATSADIQKLIKARLNEGYTYEDFCQVHKIMHAKWSTDDKMREFLRPQTLYTGKFSGYLHSQPPQTSSSGHPLQPGGLKPATSAEEIRRRHSQRPVEVTEKGEL